MHTQAVTLSRFDKQVILEQLRYIEVERPLSHDAGEIDLEHTKHNNFEDHLWQRARHLVDNNDLWSSLGHAARLARHIGILAIVIAAVLGGLGSVYAITDNHTINIYWLLLVLLGFNLFSILLWLVGITLNLGGLTAGILARMTRWQPRLLENKSTSVTRAADHAWLACHYSGTVGKWQLSKITHQLWLTYLLAGLAVLVLLLMARQYDFVWGTTLLSDATFMKLTDILGAPLQVLGFATPNADTVLNTRIGAAQALTAAYRYAWAQFLLGSLLCYGIVPRILLWCWTLLMRSVARRHFTLDYYLPYYIHLRQQLMPMAGHGQIVDADTSPPLVAEKIDISPVHHVLPEQTKWVSVELDEDIPWPPESITTTNDLGQVTDRDSLARVLEVLKTHPAPVIAVAVAAGRSPDRGVQRTIATLMSTSEQRWLVLLQPREHKPVSTTRLTAWYRLAEACQVPADHVISMSMA